MSALLVLFTSIWHISLVPKPWGKHSPREPEGREAGLSLCQCFLPSSPGSLLVEKEDLAGNEAFPWACAGEFPPQWQDRSGSSRDWEQMAGPTILEETFNCSWTCVSCSWPWMLLWEDISETFSFGHIFSHDGVELLSETSYFSVMFVHLLSSVQAKVPLWQKCCQKSLPY